NAILSERVVYRTGELKGLEQVSLAPALLCLFQQNFEKCILRRPITTAGPQMHELAGQRVLQLIESAQLRRRARLREETRIGGAGKRGQVMGPQRQHELPALTRHFRKGLFGLLSSHGGCPQGNRGKSLK